MFENLKIIHSFRNYIKILDLTFEEQNLICEYHTTIEMHDSGYLSLISIKELVELTIDILECTSDNIDDQTFNKIIKAFQKLLILCQGDIYISSNDLDVWY
jgi:hypothetical protein